MRPVIILVLLAVLLAGCETPASVRRFDPSKRVVIVAAFQPVLFGQRVGFTALLGDALAAQVPGSAISPVLLGTTSGIFRELGNEGWFAEPTNFDINQTILGVVKENLNHDITLFNGREVGLVGGVAPFGIHVSSAEELAQKEKLAALGREWNADTIVLIHSVMMRDWIQESNRSVYGIGHFYSHLEGAYCVLATSFYDCQSGRLEAGPTVKHARRPSGVTWHKTWNDYPPSEQRALLRELEVVLRESVPVLVDQLGIAKTPAKPLPVDHNFAGKEVPKSFVPDGDEFDLPSWASTQQAREAVMEAFSRHGWTVTENTNDRIVGIHPKDSKEAVCTVTFPGRKISMIPSAVKIQSDGQRVPTDYIKGWHENLKVAVMASLMKASQEETR